MALYYLWHEAWTFEHSSGSRHYVDYIFTSGHFTGVDGRAVNDLSFGFDYRAVKGELSIEFGIRWKLRKKKSMVGWKHFLNEYHVLMRYYEDLEVAFRCDPLASFSDLCGLVQGCAEKIWEVISLDRITKPWETEAYQKLLEARCRASTRTERTVLSKRIWRETRRGSMEWRSKLSDTTLNRFQKLRKNLYNYFVLSRESKICDIDA